MGTPYTNSDRSDPWVGVQGAIKLSYGPFEEGRLITIECVLNTITGAIWVKMPRMPLLVAVDELCNWMEKYGRRKELRVSIDFNVFYYYL